MNLVPHTHRLVRICAAAALLFCATAHAQGRNPASQNASASIPLPYGIEQLIADDAHSSLLAQISQDVTDSGEREYRAIDVKHIYPGGIARLFGGIVIPAASLLTPAFNSDGFGSNSAPFSVSAIGGPQNAQPVPMQDALNSPIGQSIINGFIQGAAVR